MFTSPTVGQSYVSLQRPTSFNTTIADHGRRWRKWQKVIYIVPRTANYLRFLAFLVGGSSVAMKTHNNQLATLTSERQNLSARTELGGGGSSAYGRTGGG